MSKRRIVVLEKSNSASIAMENGRILARRASGQSSSHERTTPARTRRSNRCEPESGRRIPPVTRVARDLTIAMRVMNLETWPMTSTDAAVSRRVLIADDQPDVVAALRLLLRGAGLETDAACSVQEVRDRLSVKDYDLLLMDLNYARDTTSGREGLELLSEVHERDRLLPIIVMTGWGSIETAVEAMR